MLDLPAYQQKKQEAGYTSNLSVRLGSGSDHNDFVNLDDVENGISTPAAIKRKFTSSAKEKELLKSKLR